MLAPHNHRETTEIAAPEATLPRELIGKIVVVKQPEAATITPDTFIDSLSDIGIASAVNLVGKFQGEKIVSAETCDTKRGQEALTTMLAGHNVKITINPVLAPSPKGLKISVTEYENRMFERIFLLLNHLNEAIKSTLDTRLAAKEAMVPEIRVLISHSLLLQRALEEMLKPHSSLTSAADVVGLFRPGHTFTINIEFNPKTQTGEVSLEYEGKTYEVKPIARSLLLGLPLPEQE